MFRESVSMGMDLKIFRQRCLSRRSCITTHFLKCNLTTSDKLVRKWCGDLSGFFNKLLGYKVGENNKPPSDELWDECVGSFFVDADEIRAMISSVLGLYRYLDKVDYDVDRIYVNWLKFVGRVKKISAEGRKSERADFFFLVDDFLRS